MEKSPAPSRSDRTDSSRTGCTLPHIAKHTPFVSSRGGAWQAQRQEVLVTVLLTGPLCWTVKPEAALAHGVHGKAWVRGNTHTHRDMHAHTSSRHLDLAPHHLLLRERTSEQTEKDKWIGRRHRRRLPSSIKRPPSCNQNPGQRYLGRRWGRQNVNDQLCSCRPRAAQTSGSQGQRAATRTPAHQTRIPHRPRRVQKAPRLCQGSVSEVHRVQERHRKGITGPQGANGSAQWSV